MTARIVSLLPSATEIVCILGLEDSLVGVSHECDFPPRVRRLPKVVRSSFNPATLSQSEIDAKVRAARPCRASPSGSAISKKRLALVLDRRAKWGESLLNLAGRRKGPYDPKSI